MQRQVDPHDEDRDDVHDGVTDPDDLREDLAHRAFGLRDDPSHELPRLGAPQLLQARIPQEQALQPPLPGAT
jgi:hypothetical protein